MLDTIEYWALVQLPNSGSPCNSAWPRECSKATVVHVQKLQSLVMCVQDTKIPWRACSYFHKQNNFVLSLEHEWTCPSMPIVSAPRLLSFSFSFETFTHWHRRVTWASECHHVSPESKTSRWASACFWAVRAEDLLPSRIWTQHGQQRAVREVQHIRGGRGNCRELNSLPFQKWIKHDASKSGM